MHDDKKKRAPGIFFPLTPPPPSPTNDGGFSSVLLYYLLIFVGELMGARNLVYDLCHSDHLAVMVYDGHAQNTVGAVASALIHLRIEAGILQRNKGQKQSLNIRSDYTKLVVAFETTESFILGGAEKVL